MELAGELTTARLLVAQEAAQLGLWDWDLATDALVWDERSIAMYGLAGVELSGAVGDINRSIHPDDLPDVNAALTQAIEARGVVDLEFRVVWPDGSHRWIYARGQVLVDASGAPARVIGTNADVTDARREATQRAADAVQMAGLVAVAQSLGEATDDADVLAVVTAQGMRVLGAQRVILIRHPTGLSHDIPLPAVDAALTGASHFFVDRSQACEVFPAGECALVDAGIEGIAAVPLRSGRDVVGALAVAYSRPHPWRRSERDLLAAFAALVSQALQRVAARAAERRALLEAQKLAARLALVAQVTAQLARADDVEQAVADLARLIVPALGDWCTITLVDEHTEPAGGRLPGVSGQARDVATWHAQPGMRPLVEAFARARRESVRPGAYLLQALTTGLPVTMPSPAGRALQAHLRPGAATGLLAELAPEHGVVVPLTADARTVGVLSVFSGAARPPFTDSDLTTLAEVADRAALALDAMRLRAAQRGLSEALQRSLLTELPEPDHLQLAARYVPAAAQAQIGGDWYDAFLVGEGSTCLVVGDVTGHDRQAAAAMAQVRNVLRGIAHALVGPPAVVLAELDEAMENLAVGGLATAVLATIEQTPAEVTTGERTLRWSNAGHLPPVILRPGGQAELLTRESDLLLGLDATTRRVDHTCVLEPGATVVLYSDGLVERRGEDLGDCLERLRRACADRAGLPLEELCDALLADLGAGTEDDVVLLALRAHPQDAPRPAEAGPEVLPVDLREAAESRSVRSLVPG